MTQDFLKNMSLTELKVLAYDTSRNLMALQNILDATNRRIVQMEQELQRKAADNGTKENEANPAG